MLSASHIRGVAATLLVVSSSLLTACGGDSGTDPGRPSGTGFSAIIDGASWKSAFSAAAAINGGIFTLTGSQGATALSLTLYHIGAPGTYPLGVGGTVAGGIGTVSVSPNSWSTPLSGAAGSITISAVSPTRIAGTFNFTAAPQVGQSGATRTVTSGSFDLPVSGPATLVVPDGAGSKVTGTVAGSAFNAATVVTVTLPSSGTLTFGGSNTAYSINLILSGYTGVGSYALGSGVQRTMQVTNAANQKVWGGSAGNNAGTIVITSATATRVKGTFTATLGASAVNPGEAPITLNGSFEIGYQ